MVLIFDGKKVRDEIEQDLRAKIGGFLAKPKLVILQVGDNKESAAYIQQKKSFGENIGAAVEHRRFAVEVSLPELLSAIQRFNNDRAVHGIILQLPVPAHFERQRIIDAIAPEKDVDGLTSVQVAARKRGKRGAIVPATARGIRELLEFYRIPIRGKNAAVLGRSALVGAPTAEALRNAGAEVMVCHSETPNTREITRASDIVVVAIGKPRLIGSDYFRNDKTQTVVDVGITAITEKGAERLEEEIPKRRLVGDVDFDAVKDMVAAISPVPGGVGPMTVAALFENLADSML